MKKTMIFAAVAAMFMFSSCQKEEAALEQNSPAEELVFTAAIIDQTTKTTVNTEASSADKGKVSWEVNDEITISDGTNTAVYYIAKVGDIAGDGSATFTYKSGTRPSKDAASYTATYGSAITTAQTYSATAGKLPMTGASDSGNKTKLNFFVTCGLLKLNLTALGTETDNTISKVEITGTPAGGAKTTYTLTCGSEGVAISSAADFYIALPAGSYDDMVFYNKSGYVCPKANGSGMTIEANKIQPVTLSGIVFNLLPGKFSVGANTQVRFAKGNLYYSTTDSKYHLEAAQNVTYGTGEGAYDASHVYHFFWVTPTEATVAATAPWAESFGTHTQTLTDPFFCGQANAMTVDGQNGLYALKGGLTGEWNYLFNNRTNASSLYKYGVSVTTSAGTVNNCVVIAPDGYTGSIESSYDAKAWSAAEAAGLVCLPAAGHREGSVIYSGAPSGSYWSATPEEEFNDSACVLYFKDDTVKPDDFDLRQSGLSVRLVCQVK